MRRANGLHVLALRDLEKNNLGGCERHNGARMDTYRSIRDRAWSFDCREVSRLLCENATIFKKLCAFHAI